jgi:hypothetical protein
MSDCLIRAFFVVVEKTYITQSLFFRHFFGEGIEIDSINFSRKCAGGIDT